jgi:hypothetical protein
MKRTCKALNSFLALSLLGSIAFADDLTFDVSGTLTDGALLSGNFTVDEIAGTAAAVDLTLSAPDAETVPVIGFQGVVIGGQPADGSAYLIDTFLKGAIPGAFPTFSLLLPTNTLVDYPGGPLCSLALICNGNETSGLIRFPGGQFDGPFLISGSVTPETSVPEPSTLILLGTGLIFLSAVLYRRRSMKIGGA